MPSAPGMSGRGIQNQVNSEGRIRTCDLRGMNPTSFQTAPPRTIADMRFLDCTNALLPFRNSDGNHVHVQTGILGLEPTARFYGSCFLPLGKVFRRGPDHAIRVFGLRRFSANENPWTFLVSNQGPDTYEVPALTTELKVHYQVIPGMLRILRHARE